MARRSNPTDGFGGVVRQLRLDRRLTIEEVAKRADLTASYLSKVENNRVPVPPAETLAAIADALGVPGEALTEAADGVPRRVAEAFARDPDAFYLLAEMTPKQRKEFVRQGGGKSEQQLSHAEVRRLKKKLMKG
jgi:transcriptional regulator with XRE-family HTH domain